MTRAQPSPLAAVVLAAGASTRMGDPKPLVEWRGRAFIAHVLDLATIARCEPTIVVEGAHALPRELLGHAHKITHLGWRAGQLSSLQAGLRALLSEREGLPGAAVLVLTVDRPHVQPQTVTRLAQAHASEADSIWQPSYRGELGHPIIYPGAVAHDLLDLDSTASARELLARPELAARRAHVEVDDIAVIENIDRPADLALLPTR